MDGNVKKILLSQPNTEVYMEFESRWRGKWIWKSPFPAAKEGDHEIVYFRRTFDVAAPEKCRFLARVSADSRYRLFLNGTSVSVGPCKGDRFTHYFETVDLTSYLVPGKNILAAQVLHYTVSEPFKIGIGGSASVWRSNSGAFLFDGFITVLNGNVTIQLQSDEQWKVLKDEAIRFHPGELEALYVGGVERVDGSRIPFGWQTPEYDDSQWERAVIRSEVMDATFGQLTPWTLAPRPIPELHEKHRGFAGIKRMEGGREEPNFHSYFPEPLVKGYEISAGERFMIELDAGELVTGYPFLDLSDGRGALVKILYSECYEEVPVSIGRRNKGVRDDMTKGELIGEQDFYRAAGIGGRNGNGPERYEPFSFRTFRFIRLEIETEDLPLTILRFHFRETGYPLEVKADFQSSDPSLTPLWNISIHTLQQCMHETYEDCPYYEQLQYLMDTRLQALFTYQLSGDDRLARKAIFDFHSSIMPNGMLQSRYPSVYSQIIPGFSFYWILMIDDHYRYFADLPLVRRYLPTIDAVLGWFERQLTPEGLVGRMPSHYWSFVDWVDEWRDHHGVPDAYLHSPLTVYSLMYVDALQVAAKLNDEAGRTSTADEYRDRAALIKQTIKQRCWSHSQKLFQDGPGVERYSQHAQIWAVLSGTLQDEEAGQLMDRMLEKEDLPKVSYAMSFFLFRALSKTGRYHKAFRLWDVWKRLADLNLTTWVEDPVSQRSDCHGWGAVPIYEFTAEILGVQSDGYGYRRMIIAPQPGELSWAKGSVITPHGPVSVEWERMQDGTFRLHSNSPDGIPVTFKLPDGERIERKGGGFYEITKVLQ
jgi:hypothetical protein